MDATGGTIDSLAVSDSLLPRNAVRKGVNVMLDRPRGAVSQRSGTTALGLVVSAGNTILGLHNYRTSTGTNRLLSAATTIIYSYNGTSWSSSLSGLTSGLKTRFLTYLDVCAFLNGQNQPQSFNGSAWVASGGALDINNMPIGKFATILNSRVLVAGVSSATDTVYESSLEASNAISWSSGNRNFKVFPNDGSGDITSLSGNGRLVLIFKERAMYRYDNNEVQRVANIGTTSHESVIVDDNGITYFFGTGIGGVGFYQTDGGLPQKISRPVVKWVEAIAGSFYDDVAAACDGKKIFWSVGSVTVDGTTYSKCAIVYTIADEMWEVRNYDDDFRVFGQYVNSSGNITVVGGDADGFVQTMDSGNTDNGAAIFSECEFAPDVLTGRGRIKTVNSMHVYAQDFQGLEFYMKVDNGRYEPMGSIDAREKTFKNMPKLRGQTFYPKITAVNSGTPFVFEGFEYSDVSDEGYVL